MSPEAWLPVGLVIGYLLGSIPFGLILTKLAGTQDLRSIGSGSIGATNVLRTGSKGLAAATLLGDALKGTVAVVIAGYFGGPNAAMLAALGAFLGHLFPVWLKFKGGKGVAVYIGVLIGLFWPAAVVFWRAVARDRRDHALLVAVGAGGKFRHADFLWWFGHPALASLFAVLTLLLFYAHRENIKRLQAGTEGRIGRNHADRSPPICSQRQRDRSLRDFDGPGDVLIADGVIRDSRRGIGAAGVPEGTDIVNCAGKIVAPGLIDMRAFVGEPGASHRETFASASQAAASGGITTIICQPDTSPVIDNSATVDFVLRRARDTAIVNIHPMAALTKGMRGEEMTEIGLLKAAGAVAFTDGDRSVTNAQVMRRTLTYARDFDALIVHHTEDPNLVGEGVMNEGEFAARLGLVGIPNAAEAVMLERDMRLVALTGGRYHAASLTCIESLEILQRARDAGLAVSASVSINHLTLNENDIGPYRSFLKLSPPLRTEDDRLALVAAVASGLIDVVMSDHNPQDVEVKRLPFAEAAYGAIGLQTILPAALRLIHNGETDFKTLIRAMSTRPAELLGLPADRCARARPPTSS